MRVICIDASFNKRFKGTKPVHPLVEGEVYEVRKKEMFNHGVGYYLVGIYNPTIRQGTEIPYAASRFIPLSEETENINEKKFEPEIILNS